MSRLIELLNERSTTELAIINGKQYKFHTDAGNLFRLLLVINPDQPIPQEGRQNLVTQMLPNLLINDEKNVKKLQTSFNKIKKLGKTGKKPTVAIKKEYFTLLFNLLLPLIDQPKFKPKTLTNNFSSNSTAAISFQRKATVLIGKTLLTNKDIELNAKDNLLIRGYILGLEELTAVEEGDEEFEQPQDSITSIVNETKTDEELADIKIQTDKVLNDVKTMESDTTDLTHLLNTNSTSDIFLVTLTDADVEASSEINSQINNVYNKTKDTMGIETANFTGKFISDVFKHLNNINGYLNFMKENIDIKVNKLNDGFEIVIDGDAMEDKDEFHMKRTFKTINDKTVVENNLLQIPENAQRSGINKKVFKDALNLYKAKGNIDKITLNANIDVGGYAWFRYGFIPQDTTQIDGIAQWMINISSVIFNALQYDAGDIADYILKQTHTPTQGIENFASLLRNGKTDESESIITKLLTKCSQEFKQTFDEKEKFKELGKNIAIMNFKEYNISGTTYSISYKALLSIQALTIDGFKPIPLQNRGTPVFLNWAGELDMNDLDDTYAYLNLTKK